LSTSDTVNLGGIDILAEDFLSISDGWNLAEAVKKEYREIIDIFGIDVALKLFQHYRGCKLVCPKYFYNADFVIKVAAQKEDKREREKIAVLCGYTAEWLEQRVRKYWNQQSERGD
jgi:hypothetical protein